MEKHYYPTCNCKKTSQHPDYDLDHKNHSCTRCCSHDCCTHKCCPHQGCHDSCKCCCCRSRCRKNLCDTNFSIRLGGLQNGLNFRLRQLLWCEAEFELEGENIVKGTIVSVGSNFVEVLVKESLQLESGDHVEEVIEESSEEKMDKELTEKHLVEEKELDDEEEERIHKKCKSWIFSIDKIANIKVNRSCHCQCTSH